MKLIFMVLACSLLALAESRSADAQQCTFYILVKTGDRDNAGTDARISLQVSSGPSGAPTLAITNLESWGQMSTGHDYFERGNFDLFKGTGPCMAAEPCKMVLTSDNSGNKPGWYVSYVTLIQLAKGSASSMGHEWAVEEWLFEAPYMLSVTRNACN